MPKRKGKIIPHGVSLEKHENDIVVIFTELGFDVELIPPSFIKGVHTADAIIDGVEWEFKSPQGVSHRTLERILSKAVRQSPNIIVDLRRMKLSDEKSMSIIRKELLHRKKTIKRLKIITKRNRVVDILGQKRIIKLTGRNRWWNTPASPLFCVL